MRAHLTVPSRFILAAALALFAGCAAQRDASLPANRAAVRRTLHKARAQAASAEERAADYLHAAAGAAKLLQPGDLTSPAHDTYNVACAELTALLRSADNGRLWNRPLTLSAHGRTWQLRFAPGTKSGVWAPEYFTEFELASHVQKDLVKSQNLRAGFGGELVGVRKLDPREKFAPRAGIAAAVTATLTFHGSTATLTLNDPMKLATVRINGRSRPLAADFSAALCFYPAVNEFWIGLFEGLRPGKFEDREGIYLLQPYDPARIPVFYVHGLISTPYIWRDPINEIDMDPVLRARYQPVVFGYPTGNPVAFSALRFREGLAEFEKLYPMPQGFVLISHSLGGLVSQMQTETITRADWDRTLGKESADLFAKISPGGEVERALTFTANPKAKRVVFISTPHLGADLAVQTLGQLAMRLIRLPASMVGTLQKSLGTSLKILTGQAGRLPTGVSSLSPKNPTLHVLASKEVLPPSHSIIGNRGIPGPLADSSDGIVPYWSSHLSYAKSEVIVPGPHSCYDYPGAITEMKRVLHLQLSTSGR